MLEVVLPLLQAYALNPDDAVRMTDPPAQNVVGPAAVMVAVSAAGWLIEMLIVFEQPLASVTVKDCAPALRVKFPVPV